MMRRFASKHTTPELDLRRALHRMGLRYRVQLAVPGAPRRSIDIAFTRRKMAVFVDGCYWHGCSEHGKVPARNSEWWAAKILRNQERDLDTTRLLVEQGWLVLRYWEHEDPQVAARAIADALHRRQM